MSEQTEEFDNREDMENIGRAFMATIARNLSGYSWLNCPSESIVDLINERDALQKERDDLKQFHDWAEPQIVTHGIDQARIASLEQSLAAAQADAERMRKALNHIGFLPLGHPEATVAECLSTAETIAREALAMKGKP